MRTPWRSMLLSLTVAIATAGVLLHHHRNELAPTASLTPPPPVVVTEPPPAPEIASVETPPAEAVVAAMPNVLAPHRKKKRATAKADPRRALLSLQAAQLDRATSTP